MGMGINGGGGGGRMGMGIKSGGIEATAAPNKGKIGPATGKRGPNRGKRGDKRAATKRVDIDTFFTSFFKNTLCAPYPFKYCEMLRCIQQSKITSNFPVLPVAKQNEDRFIIASHVFM
ncbi:MAG TPA: hypothetical protein VEG44_03445 [Candidatus Acidoferrales bacterium]|nr:hypothetical protein [Candidatus Acidoferrales bacterium]